MGQREPGAETNSSKRWAFVFFFMPFLHRHLPDMVLPINRSNHVGPRICSKSGEKELFHCGISARSAIWLHCAIVKSSVSSLPDLQVKSEAIETPIDKDQPFEVISDQRTWRK
jgi:hypothetical protein